MAYTVFLHAAGSVLAFFHQADSLYPLFFCSIKNVQHLALYLVLGLGNYPPPSHWNRLAIQPNHSAELTQGAL
jgi:hypothetical protein